MSSNKVYLVVNEEERVVWVSETIGGAETHCLGRDVIVPVDLETMAEGSFPLFWLPKLHEYNPVDLEELVEINSSEIADVYRRVEDLEEDIYGETRPAIHVELQLEDDDGLN